MVDTVKVLQLLSSDWYQKLSKDWVDNAISIENLSSIKKLVLDKLPPKDRFLLEEGLSSRRLENSEREFTAV